MREITLTRGHFAIVDDDDYHWLKNYRWCANYNGGGNAYAVRFENRYTTRGKRKRKCIRMHREILERHLGNLNKFEVDHVNRNGLDNRKDNIRVVTRRENLLNRKHYSNSKSGVRGVYWDKNLLKWVAHVTIDKKKKHLGVFLDLSKASEAVELARAKKCK